MLLVSAKVGPFKSINEPQTVLIDKSTTVLVGMNESGKTVFLKALEKSSDAMGIGTFDPVDDYPRKDLPAYLKQHKSKPSKVTEFVYQLNETEVAELNVELGTKLPAESTFSVSHFYDNKTTIGLTVDERPVIETFNSDSTLSSDAKAAIKKATNIRGVQASLKELSLNEVDTAFLSTINERVAKAETVGVNYQSEISRNMANSNNSENSDQKTRFGIEIRKHKDILAS